MSGHIPGSLVVHMLGALRSSLVNSSVSLCVSKRGFSHTAGSRAQPRHLSSEAGMRLKKEGSNKNKAVAKKDLPSKTCVVCKRPFTWRKKWEDCWDDVKYVSPLFY